MLSRFYPERFVQRCNDGGSYYLRQVEETDTMFWFGEAANLQFSNVFMGSLAQRGDEDYWEGRFWDVPKGVLCGHGNLNIRVNTGIGAMGPTWNIRKVSGSGFGGNEWNYHSPMTALVELRGKSSAGVSAGFQGRGAPNLSGTWRGDRGGTYYINDMPSSNEFIWFAEHHTAQMAVPRGGGVPAALPGVGWANVFVGERSGTSIEGVWSDVPKGGANNYGRLTLVLENAFTLRIIHQEGGYGETTLWRYESLNVDIDIPRLEIHRAEDSGDDEPKLHIVLALVDGEKVNRTLLASSSAKLDPRDTGRLASSVGAGRELPLGEFGAFSSVVKTILGSDPRAAGAPEVLVGVDIGAWDEDSSSSSTRSRAFSDWRDMLQRNMDRDIRAGRTPDFRALAGRRHFSWNMFVDDDDHLGDDSKVWSYADLTRLIGSSEAFQLRMTGDGADYRVPGSISVSSRLNARCAR